MAPAFDRLARTPWPIASLASSGIRAFSSPLARSWSRKASLVVRNKSANSAHEFDVLMSTIRTASIRGFGGSTPKRGGGSPLLTQPQNLPSASHNKSRDPGLGRGGDLGPLPAPVVYER